MDWNYLWDTSFSYVCNFCYSNDPCQVEKVSSDVNARYVNHDSPISRSKSSLSRAPNSTSHDPLPSSSISHQKLTDKDEEASSPQSMPLYDQPQKQSVCHAHS